MTSSALHLEPLELAAGFPLGRDPAVPPLARVARGGSRRAFEDLVRDALARTPCIVSFSGGRDSTAVLGVAVHVARRDGFELPIPATLRFPGLLAADERAWQERAVRGFGLDDWPRIDANELADAAGAPARAELRQHGVMYPPNAYLHAPILNLAAGGSLLTGIGGDEVLDSPAERGVRVLTGRVRPRPSDLLAFAMLARPQRHRRAAAALSTPLVWLQPDAVREVARRYEHDRKEVPLSWRAALRRWPADRYYIALRTTLQTLAAAAGVHAINPFLEPAFLAAIASDGGAGGFVDRRAALRQLVGDVVEPEFVGRTDKAVFSEAVFGAQFRRFVNAWNGAGLDASIVDVERLRLVWQQATPDYRTLLLLHTLLRADHNSHAHGEVRERVEYIR